MPTPTLALADSLQDGEDDEIEERGKLQHFVPITLCNSQCPMRKPSLFSKAVGAAGAAGAAKYSN